ncbi:MAG: hypothetical protein WDZ85_01670 [Candidatus Paceibacterota bacterium]
MKSNILIVALLIVLLGLGGYYFLDNKNKSSHFKKDQTTKQEDNFDSSIIPKRDSNNIDNAEDIETDQPIIESSNTGESSIVSEKPLAVNSAELNIGNIEIRAIVVNIDETGDKYGSYGQKFTQQKISEVESALNRLKSFIKQSSYEKANLTWDITGVYELGSGVCNHSSYGEKTEDLIQRALKASDSEKQLDSKTYYLVVHPSPDCSDGQMWSYEGKGTYKNYTVNGRTISARGVRISDLSDFYLFHEFGHSLGYKPNTGIGHPDYLKCSLSESNNQTTINLSNSCQQIYDWSSGNIPTFSVMTGNRSTLSDYSVLEKNIIGWLSDSDIMETTSGTYELGPVEQKSDKLKALKIPVTGIDYDIYLSYRKPSNSNTSNGYNGVMLETLKYNSIISFLVTDNYDMDKSLEVGKKYRLGDNGPTIIVNSILNNTASITVSK